MGLVRTAKALQLNQHPLMCFQPLEMLRPPRTQYEATDDARPPKISGLQPASEPLSLSGEASVAKIGLTKWNSAAIPTSAERLDQMFQEFENYRAKPGE
jgi:hypothetical protein